MELSAPEPCLECMRFKPCWHSQDAEEAAQEARGAILPSESVSPTLDDILGAPRAIRAPVSFKCNYCLGWRDGLWDYRRGICGLCATNKYAEREDENGEVDDE